ncbi:TPA: hypothetical protein ACKPX2_001513 [Stenotrophomonas maltophilia]|uniref:hypothetical protein n=1 Tax=Stenotrophomonas TaxID=40323 RepID=UPI0038C41085
MTTDNKTLAVDVLAVIMESADFMREDGYIHRAIPLEEAHAAVAELIEAANLLVAESVHPYDGGEYEDGEWIALDRARSALARVKGESV